MSTCSYFLWCLRVPTFCGVCKFLLSVMSTCSYFLWCLCVPTFCDVYVFLLSLVSTCICLRLHVTLLKQPLRDTSPRLPFSFEGDFSSYECKWVFVCMCIPASHTAKKNTCYTKFKCVSHITYISLHASYYVMSPRESYYIH